MGPWIEKDETQTRRLEPTGLAKPGETHGLTGTGPGFARQDAAGQVFGQIRNWTKQFLGSEPRPIANTMCYDRVLLVWWKECLMTITV